jgi:hypothetical protein
MGEAEFKGWLLPGPNGEFIYCPSDFVERYENGGVFCADEWDASDANVAVFINKAIGNKSFHLPQRKGNTLVKKHKDFIFIACANTFGNGADFVYVGRNQLDEATLDRFKCGTVPMNYDPAVEKKLVDPDVLWWGTIVREALIQLQQTNKFVSTRLMIDFSDMKKLYGWGLSEFYQRYLAAWDEDSRTRLIQVCKTLLAKDISKTEKKLL